MATLLQSQKFNVANVNSGNRYIVGDGILPSALNAMAEGILYNTENSINKSELDLAKSEIEQLQIRVTNLEGETLTYTTVESNQMTVGVPSNASTYSIVNKVSGWSGKQVNPNSKNLYLGSQKISVAYPPDTMEFIAPKDGYYSFNANTTNVVNPDVTWLNSSLNGENWIMVGFPFENIYLSKGETVWFTFEESPEVDDNDNPKYPLSGHITDIMINEGASSLPYESAYYDGILVSKPTSIVSKNSRGDYIDSYIIPQSILYLPNFGVTGNYIDFDRKYYVQTKYYEGEILTKLSSPIETDISAYLTDYYNYNFLRVEQGGTIVIENTYGITDVSSTITFVSKNE